MTYGAYQSKGKEKRKEEGLSKHPTKQPKIRGESKLNTSK